MKQISNPAVSVVIPTYKRADMLPYLLDALRRQTYRNFDVVVVVKPAGDGTEELLLKAQTELKISIVVQKGGYIVDAYFLGVKHTTGDIVVYFDADSVPEKDAFKKVAPYFEDKKNLHTNKATLQGTKKNATISSNDQRSCH